MAHNQQRDFCNKVKNLFPEYFDNVRVLDIGSLDINGSNHFLFTNYVYMGIDVGKGRNVNYVSLGHEYKPLDNKKYDIVISTECFEHDKHWDKTIQNVIDNLLKPNGMFIFTCATTGRAEHGTRRTTKSDSPFTSQMDDWSDYYKNLTEEDMKFSVDLSSFIMHRFYVNEESHDLYFWGILK
jgi:SAM-dependent methyltransferase